MIRKTLSGLMPSIVDRGPYRVVVVCGKPHVQNATRIVEIHMMRRKEEIELITKKGTQIIPVSTSTGKIPAADEIIFFPVSAGSGVTICIEEVDTLFNLVFGNSQLDHHFASLARQSTKYIYIIKLDVKQEFCENTTKKMLSAYSKFTLCNNLCIHCQGEIGVLFSCVYECGGNIRYCSAQCRLDDTPFHSLFCTTVLLSLSGTPLDEDNKNIFPKVSLPKFSFMDQTRAKSPDRRTLLASPPKSRPFSGYSDRFSVSSTSRPTSPSVSLSSSSLSPSHYRPAHSHSQSMSLAKKTDRR